MTQVETNAQVGDVGTALTTADDQHADHPVCSRDGIAIRLREVVEVAPVVDPGIDSVSDDAEATSHGTETPVEEAVPGPTTTPSPSLVQTNTLGGESTGGGVLGSVADTPSRIDRGAEELIDQLPGSRINLDKWIWAIFVGAAAWLILVWQRRYRARNDIGLVEVRPFVEGPKAVKGSAASTNAVVHETLRLMGMQSATGPDLWAARPAGVGDDVVAVISELADTQGKTAAAVLTAMRRRPKTMVEVTVVGDALVSRMTGNPDFLNDVPQYYEMSAASLPDSTTASAAYLSGVLAWAAESRVLAASSEDLDEHKTYPSAEAAGLDAIYRLSESIS